MRILLAAKHAPEGSRPIGGVQTWCRTVAAELRRIGHEAVTWGPEQALPEGRFELGIVANAEDARAALPLCDRVFGVSHGIIPAERPIGPEMAFTSEEVRDHWNGTGPVIRQPIDLEFWRPANCERKFLTRFSYRRGLDFLPTVAESLGLEFQHVSTATPGQARAILQQSACVLATGRAALEAMACGAPVVICDHRSAYQGPLMSLDVGEAMLTNYSGRGGIEPDAESVEHAVRHAMSWGDDLLHVQMVHDVRKVVPKLLEAAWSTC